MVTDHGAIVIYTGGDVAKVRRRQGVARQHLEVHHVDRLVRRVMGGADLVNALADRRGLLSHGARQQRRKREQATKRQHASRPTAEGFFSLLCSPAVVGAEQSTG